MVGGLGKLIVQRRKDLGLSQQDLARKLGVPAANLSQLEHSASRWRSRLIPALADALRVSQLELALAAGIIDDLPPFPTPDLPLDFEDPLYPAIARDSKPSDRPVVRLNRVANDLTPNEIEFLLAVAEMFLHRRQQSSANGATASVIGREQNGLVELEV